MICKLNLRFFTVVISTFMIFTCNNGKRPVVGATDFQREMNAKFKDVTTSPLSASDLKVFKNLNFFELDSTFVVTGVLKRTPNAEFFEMKTTTNRLSRERVFGIITVNLQNKRYRLNVYQGEENMQSLGNKDYLFLPFIDDTNGEESYAGGRYIDLRIPEGDSIVIDFNKAYNPYCDYNTKFSCPIVPRENYIDIPVKAGLKKFKIN
jgi:uncharacterized protein